MVAGLGSVAALNVKSFLLLPRATATRREFARESADIMYPKSIYHYSMIPTECLRHPTEIADLVIKIL